MASAPPGEPFQRLLGSAGVNEAATTGGESWVRALNGAPAARVPFNTHQRGVRSTLRFERSVLGGRRRGTAAKRQSAAPRL